jgi:hypothetical protein
MPYGAAIHSRVLHLLLGDGFTLHMTSRTPAWRRRNRAFGTEWLCRGVPILPGRWSCAVFVGMSNGLLHLCRVATGVTLPEEIVSHNFCKKLYEAAMLARMQAVPLCSA